MGPKCVCLYRYNYYMRLNNPSQLRKGYEQAEAGVVPSSSLVKLS